MEPAWAWKECSLLSSTKCRQSTISAQHSINPMDCATPDQFPPQKLLDARRWLGGNLKSPVHCWYRSKSRAFSWFFLSLGKPHPASWVKESWGSHSSLWASSPNLWAQLSHTDVLILLGPYRVWPWHLSLTSCVSSKTSAAFCKSLTVSLVANLPYGSWRHINWEEWSHGTQWHALCVPAKQKAAAWHCPASSFRGKNRASKISFA